MRTKTIRIVVVVGAILLLTAASYTYKKKSSVREELEARYSLGLKVAFDKDNIYCPEAQIAYYDSVISNSTLSERKKFSMEYNKGLALLKLGEEQKAIEILSGVADKIKSNKDDKLAEDPQIYLALAYLRAGEKNNCIEDHSSGSCLFPIRGNGIYKDGNATRNAIEIYQGILQKDSGDLESRWLLNLAYMTIGEYPQSVPTKWLIPGMDADTSSYKVKPFQDMAGLLSLTEVRNMAGGVIVDDFNNDGYLDIITSAWGSEDPMHYFRNNCDGTFTDVSKESGLGAIKGGLNILQADYNNDGYTDMLVLRGAWQGEFGKQPNSLLRNNGDGTFTDVTIESGILSFHPTQTAAWADFNNDGWLDLFIGNETSNIAHPHPAELFISNRDGTFTNVANEAGCSYLRFMKGVSAADYNNDGWPDIFISDLSGKKILLKNKGLKSNIPQFEDATHEARLDSTMTYSFPTWFWDYNNDGWPDIFVCGYQSQGSLAKPAAEELLNRSLDNVSKMYLYRNNHDGTFTEVSKATGLDRPVFAMGSNFGDIDNDGWLDMYLGTGNPDFRSLVPNRMFRNIDGQKFAEVTTSARVGNLQKGHGVAFADIDNDGDQDIFIEVGGAVRGDAYYNSFFVNPGQNNNNWISVLLEGTSSNRSAIGARIVVTFTENGAKRTVYRDINSGGSFGSSPLRKEIGIGKATMIDELIIKWPTSGNVQVFKNVAPDQFLKIKEGSDKVNIVKLKSLKWKVKDDVVKMISCAPSLKKK